jgi:hypothetical protein
MAGAAWLLAHAARTGALRSALTLIGDKGFAGREFEDLLTTTFGLRLVRPDRRDEAPATGPSGGSGSGSSRSTTPSKGQLDMERHGGRTTAGVYARIAQRLNQPAIRVSQSAPDLGCRVQCGRGQPGLPR